MTHKCVGKLIILGSDNGLPPEWCNLQNGIEMLQYEWDNWANVLNTRSRHDNVIKWEHFPRYWPFVRGIHRSPVNSPHKSLWRGPLMFSSICAWINGWVNVRWFETPSRPLWCHCNEIHFSFRCLAWWYCGCWCTVNKGTGHPRPISVVPPRAVSWNVLLQFETLRSIPVGKI